MAYVKLVGTANPHTSWIERIILEKDGEGNVTKEIVAGKPIDLEANVQKEYEARGFVFEKSSKDELEKYDAGGLGVGSDVVGNAPVLGNAGTAGVDQTNQTSSRDNDVDNKK